jgi:hypothetical protein
MLRIIFGRGLTKEEFGNIIPIKLETEIITEGKGYLMISLHARGGGRGRWEMSTEKGLSGDR